MHGQFSEQSGCFARCTEKCLYLRLLSSRLRHNSAKAWRVPRVKLSADQGPSQGRHRVVRVREPHASTRSPDDAKEHLVNRQMLPKLCPTALINRLPNTSRWYIKLCLTDEARKYQLTGSCPKAVGTISVAFTNIPFTEARKATYYDALYTKSPVFAALYNFFLVLQISRRS